MQVFQLLKHDRIAHDGLRMRSFLPDLILAFGFVWRALVAQLAQQPVTTFFLQVFEDSSRGMAFQIGQDASQLRRGNDRVEVGVEYDPGIEFERFMLATVLERIDQDVAARRGSEDGKPGNGRSCDEMGMSAFEDSVPAAHGGGFMI